MPSGGSARVVVVVVGENGLSGTNTHPVTVRRAGGHYWNTGNSIKSYFGVSTRKFMTIMELVLRLRTFSRQLLVTLNTRV